MNWEHNNGTYKYSNWNIGGTYHSGFYPWSCAVAACGYCYTQDDSMLPSKADRGNETGYKRSPRENTNEQ